MRVVGRSIWKYGLHRRYIRLSVSIAGLGTPCPESACGSTLTCRFSSACRIPSTPKGSWITTTSPRCRRGSSRVCRVLKRCEYVGRTRRLAVERFPQGLDKISTYRLWIWTGLPVRGRFSRLWLELFHGCRGSMVQIWIVMTAFGRVCGHLFGHLLESIGVRRNCKLPRQRCWTSLGHVVCGIKKWLSATCWLSSAWRVLSTP